jgi:hypothetical protein
MALKSGGESSLIHKQGVQVFHGVVYEGALLSTLLRSLLIPVANNPQGLTLGVVLGKNQEWMHMNIFVTQSTIALS